jgi:hypothetical protein
VAFFSCNPEEELPPETILEFVSVHQFRDSLNNIVGINIRINYQDGDGNIGFLGRDTTDNLFIHVFDRISLTDAIYEPLQDLNPTEPSDVVIRFSIPDLNPGRQQSVRGFMDIRIRDAQFEFMQLASEHGIVGFNIYMYDRDLVQSNTVEIRNISIR